MACPSDAQQQRRQQQHAPQRAWQRLQLGQWQRVGGGGGGGGPGRGVAARLRRAPLPALPEPLLAGATAAPLPVGSISGKPFFLCFLYLVI